LGFCKINLKSSIFKVIPIPNITTPSKIVIFETVQEKVIGKNNATAVTIITISDIFFCTNLFIELNAITPKNFFRYFITTTTKISDEIFFFGDNLFTQIQCQANSPQSPAFSSSRLCNSRLISVRSRPAFTNRQNFCAYK